MAYGYEQPCLGLARALSSMEEPGGIPGHPSTRVEGNRDSDETDGPNIQELGFGEFLVHTNTHISFMK